MNPDTVRETFTAALDALVEQIRGDRSILAAILCGSLSHDTVWSKSDIDLALITIDDKKIEANSLALYADGVNVHAMLFPRTEFRTAVEGELRNSFMHSLLAKGRLLYTHDETIARLENFYDFRSSRDVTRYKMRLQAGLHSTGSTRLPRATLIRTRRAGPTV